MAYYPGPFGFWQIGCQDGAVVWLKCTAEPGGANHPSPLSDTVYEQLCAYLAGKRQTFDFSCRPKGTPFQQAVWRALQEIPFGQTRTYGEIARQIGHPGACRAVGAASGKNPIWIAIPCHRCVGADGRLTGYAGGLAMKRALLETEGQIK
ncbi:MAG: methylated-DNA--[protein]-cysteine S-methyltransferase [Clostridiales bacterium]|nr:methylated-DNA--[protein]-cysteine S-methyltransferase [Candidatus Cacconaster stercorequi]